MYVTLHTNVIQQYHWVIWFSIWGWKKSYNWIELNEIKLNWLSCVVALILQALDYEEIKTINLGLRVSNKAKYNFGVQPVPSLTTLSKTYQIKVNVENEKEGPRFQPTTKVVTVSEDHESFSTTKVITTYAAIDSDTLQTATNVRYVNLERPLKMSLGHFISTQTENIVFFQTTLTCKIEIKIINLKCCSRFTLTANSGYVWLTYCPLTHQNDRSLV